jgi:capsule polysaccharide modification protein KpsS
MSWIAKLVLAAGLGLAACTPMAWTRPDTSDVQLAADRNECRAIAQQQMQSLAFRYSLLRPYPIFRRRNGRYVFDPNPFDDDFFGRQALLTRDLERDCLTAKGYSLVPVKP